MFPYIVKMYKDAGEILWRPWLFLVAPKLKAERDFICLFWDWGKKSLNIKYFTSENFQVILYNFSALAPLVSDFFCKLWFCSSSPTFLHLEHMVDQNNCQSWSREKNHQVSKMLYESDSGILNNLGFWPHQLSWPMDRFFYTNSDQIITFTAPTHHKRPKIIITESMSHGNAGKLSCSKLFLSAGPN